MVTEEPPPMRHLPDHEGQQRDDVCVFQLNYDVVFAIAEVGLFRHQSVPCVVGSKNLSVAAPSYLVVLCRQCIALVFLENIRHCLIGGSKINAVVIIIH